MNWWHNLLAQYGFRNTIAKNPVPMTPVEVKLVVVQQPNSVQRTLQEEREKVAERVKNREEEGEQREREKKKIFAPFKKILEELSENKTIRVDGKPPEFTIFDTKATVKFGRHELTLDTLVSWGVQMKHKVGLRRPYRDRPTPEEFQTYICGELAKAEIL